jgi:hypothetical protein
MHDAAASPKSPCVQGIGQYGHAHIGLLDLVS